MLERHHDGQISTKSLRAALRPSGAILEADTAMTRAIENAVGSASDLDTATLDLLVRLRIAPEQRLRGVDLCAQMLRSASHVSRLTDRAQAAGYVDRLPDPHDRRAQQIVLIENGREAVDAVIPSVLSVIDEAVYSVLQPDEIDVLVELLTRIADAAKARLARTSH